MQTFRTDTQQKIKMAFVITGFIVCVIAGYVGGKATSLMSLQNELSIKNSYIKHRLQTELSRYAEIANIYSNNQAILQRLNQDPEMKLPTTQNALNHQLSDLQQATKALDVYLIAPSGNVIASSNWQQQDSFIGNNFAFRRYFKLAMTQGIGFELALGAVSNKRGVYFSAAIKQDQNIIGVLVVKVDVASLEQDENLFPLGDNIHFVIQGDKDLIFLSDKASWRLKSLQSKNSAKYQGSDTLTYHIEPFWQQWGVALWHIEGLGLQQKYVVSTDKFANYPWQIKILAADSSTTLSGVTISLVAGSSYIAFIFLWLFYSERRKNIAHLKQSRDELEILVKKRTYDLMAANSKLTTEIEQRIATEHELLTTQEELIQAAKLATIGQLSSSINHELNQPLAALSSYLQTVEKMLAKNMQDKIPANIERMHKLIERLTSIVAQFKNFSRKTNEPLKPLNVRQVLLNAMGIVSHHVQQNGITLKFQMTDEQLWVNAEQIQLEQVIVNILSNGVDALQDIELPQICIHVFAANDKVNIEIKDNGEGIAPHHLGQVFEPFFTTKSAQGLGLGLSISRRIIESFGGELKVDNGESEGAIFTIILPCVNSNNSLKESKRG